MCGRFTLTLDAERLTAAFPPFIFPPQVQPRYNIAPGQPLLTVLNDGSRHATHVVWSFVPAWAKDPRRYRFINIRAETAAHKPSFRAAFHRRRCLVFADGFYEWQRENKKRLRPYYFSLHNRQPFAIAALWEPWQGADGSEITGCALLTTQANALVRAIHPRMPVILPPEAWDAWLAPGEQPAKALQPLLRPFPAEAMQMWPGSEEVNRATVDAPHLITAREP